MKHLRSQINMLDAQRDLMKVNYPFLADIGNDIAELSQDVIDRMRGQSENHLDGLREIKNIAINLNTNAKSNNPDALVLANQVRAKCMTCHSLGSPSSGYDWKDISRNNWDDIIVKCNSAFRNPYRCKSMYGMMTNYGYFLTGIDANSQNYAMAATAAKELKETATDLKLKGMVHEGAGPLDDILKRASEVEALATKQDPSTFVNGAGIAQSCMACHGASIIR
jgi:hypothetical protein